jgi:hypothetical protein
MNRGSVLLGRLGLLGALGIVVVLAIVGLYVALARSEQVANTGSREAPKNSEPARLGTDTPRIPRPVAGGGAGGASNDGAGSAEGYTIGNVNVRDHRSRTQAQLDVPPVIHAPQGRRIQSTLTSAISQHVRAAVATCAVDVPQSARGARARIEGQITIAIKNQQATITGAVVQLRDVTGIAFDPIKQCVEQRSIGATTSSSDEPDIDSYGITLSLRLP